MIITPLQFGSQVGLFVGTGMKKQALLAFDGIGRTGAAIGAGIGAATAPSGHRIEGAARGGAKGLGAGIGAEVGGVGGTLLAALALARANKGSRLSRALGLLPDVRTTKRVVRRGTPDKEALRHGIAHLALSGLAGGVPGAVAGGYGGASLAGGAMGKPSWEAKVKSAAAPAVRAAGNKLVAGS